MGDALSVPFIVSWISTIVKIPIETTNRIEALALLSSFSVFRFFPAISRCHKLPNLT